jgi:hypothetical protein
MADTKETVVFIDAHEAQRRAAAEKVRAMEAGELKELDTCIPGGLYKSPDGQWHDAHGRVLGGEDGELASDKQWELPPAISAQVGGPEVTDAAKTDDSAEENEWRKDMREQRRESIANPVEGAPVSSEAVIPAFEEDEDETDAEGKKTGRKVKRAARRRK